MNEDLNFLIEIEILIYLLLFTILLGFEVISKVPSVLHTPLMSGANAISGIVILGAIILIRTTDPSNVYTLILASLALLVGSCSDLNPYLYSDGDKGTPETLPVQFSELTEMAQYCVDVYDDGTKVGDLMYRMYYKDGW